MPSSRHLVLTGASFYKKQGLGTRIFNCQKFVRPNRRTSNNKWRTISASFYLYVRADVRYVRTRVIPAFVQAPRTISFYDSSDDARED